MTWYESLKTIEYWVEDARDCFMNNYPGNHWPEDVYITRFPEVLEAIEYLKKYFNQGVKAEQ